MTRYALLFGSLGFVFKFKYGQIECKTCPREKCFKLDWYIAQTVFCLKVYWDFKITQFT